MSPGAAHPSPAAVEVELLRRDIHPAEVSIDGEVLTSARVFVTDRRLLAFRVGEGGIEVALDLELERPCSVPASRGSLQGCLEAHLSDGRVAWINRGHGCGCGSPLKALGPPVPWTAPR
jgi:hypothetical protein